LAENAVISIVDDDESVRMATMKLLRLHGYVAHAFASAQEFLQSRYVDDTRCLISDVRMPGMSGLALQEQLTVKGHRIPIIFVTAYPEERSRTQAMEGGAVCFLGKPFDGRTLIECIGNALRKHAG
jgi:FixJ family two-component response regulator